MHSLLMETVDLMAHTIQSFLVTQLVDNIHGFVTQQTVDIRLLVGRSEKKLDELSLKGFFEEVRKLGAQ